MKVAIACDHIVTDIKDKMVTFLRQAGYEVVDCGTYDFVRTHYPIFGHKAASLVATNQVDKAVIMCGTGVGISNAANKTKNIRAALVRDLISARQAVEEFNANVIAVGGRITGIGLIEEIYQTFLETKYQPTPAKDARIEKINALITHDNYADNIFDSEIQKWQAGYYHD
ncbi:RpiB/LacA/LacB family sugar-phosphate isomerase [Spiroplasma eriocheiris]|uniref:Galactose-6-phosphate isomerase n=1 Tax=Spiroplasma eriocheiris TaxID=315358 RepID=A0A0H3XK03_9MOLU|nr:RpiB/LacA/LacB family sugar-phosphate isomerase [Spiroplasma eriocheiris]AHF57192.1 galactose-6-phosphate isomerase subunit LacB [Spiroplasma eriocheiris CCTCC M 207170]AKM53659.1 galactose-6-phosphate isomerase [Spiroplasma eriocheiris]